jgi:FkbM family methyltransferase
MLTLPAGVVRFFVKNRKLGLLALRLVPDMRRRIEIDHIGPFEIRLRRHRSFWIRSPIAAEAVMLGYLKHLTRPGDVAYDIGANVGLYARFLASFGAGQVIAFEPMRDNVELLQANVALAGADASKLRVECLAVGDKDGEELLQVDDVMSATASLDRLTDGDPSYGRKTYGLPPLTERVRIARLDTLIAQGLPPPQVMKIDVEGAEIWVLEGASKTLTEHRPGLAIELHGLDKAEGVLDLLDRHGYQAFAYVLEGKRAVYRRILPGESAVLGPYGHIVAHVDPSRVQAPIPALS